MLLASALPWNKLQSQYPARYEGMGQRLDYHLLSPQLLPRLERCTILGYGTERTGFMGSDHCPVLLTFKASTAAPPCSQSEPEAQKAADRMAEDTEAPTEAGGL